MDFDTLANIVSFIADLVIIFGAIGLTTPQGRRLLKKIIKALYGFD